jgi:acetyl-CoA carboxylase biotin carboxyl carrier protein
VPFTEDEIRHIVEAIEHSEWDEVRLVADGTTLVVSRSGETTLATAPAAAAPPDGAAATAVVPAPAPAAEKPRPAAPTEAVEPLLDEAHGQTAAPPASTEHREVTTVGAPSLGLFWRSPKPGAPPFVEVGDRVEADSTICIVEVMKLMNHVKAGCAGVVSAIHPDNGAMVEYGQPLVTIAID